MFKKANQLSLNLRPCPGACGFTMKKLKIIMSAVLFTRVGNMLRRLWLGLVRVTIVSGLVKLPLGVVLILRKIGAAGKGSSRVVGRGQQWWLVDTGVILVSLAMFRVWGWYTIPGWLWRVSRV